MTEIIVGAVLGFLSGLGVGGGSLLILWLTLMRAVDPFAARGINLLFFLPCALIAAIFRWKQGSLPLKKIYPAILTGCASALVFSAVGTRLNTAILKKLFGGLLMITGIREFFYKPNRKREGP